MLDKKTPERRLEATRSKATPSSTAARPAVAGSFYVLRGQIARMDEKPESDNPYEAGSAEAVLWKYGYRRETSGRKRLVSRETSQKKGRKAQTHKPQTRKAWSDEDRRVLRLCWAHMGRQEIADILGRTLRSVVNEASRLGLRQR